MLCRKHISQLWRHGDFLDSTIYDSNEYITDGGVVKIILKDKHCRPVGEAIIDLDDLDRCKAVKWYARKTKNGIYAIGTVASKKVFLHRFVLNYDGHDDVDHINRNTLDNRKSNLRIVPHQINAANNASTGVRRTPSGKYQAFICHNYKTLYLGSFASEEEAIEYRRNKKRELFGV